MVNGQCTTDANGVPKWSSSPGVNVSTQTVGLYYPSQRDITRREQELGDKEKAAKDQKIMLTPVSPGRGTCLVQ